MNSKERALSEREAALKAAEADVDFAHSEAEALLAAQQARQSDAVQLMPTAAPQVYRMMSRMRTLIQAMLAQHCVA